MSFIRFDRSASVLLLVLLAATILVACAGAPAGQPTPLATATPGVSAPPATVVEVTGIEYAFQGVPASVAAGTNLTFRNGGSEVHEMVVLRRNDDVTKSFAEILAEGEAASRAQVTIMGVTSALPGEAAETGVTVGQPGQYALVCFIPVGTVPGASAAGGPPHLIRGMVAEFTVNP